MLGLSRKCHSLEVVELSGQPSLGLCHQVIEKMEQVLEERLRERKEPAPSSRPQGKPNVGEPAPQGRSRSK